MGSESLRKKHSPRWGTTGMDMEWERGRGETYRVGAGSELNGVVSERVLTHDPHIPLSQAYNHTVTKTLAF